MSAEPKAEPTRSAKLARVLAVIAAVLAFSAAIVRYVAEREIDYTALGGGGFMLALAFAAGRQK